MVFKDRNAQTYKVWVKNSEGEKRRVSTGVQDERTAKAISAMLSSFYRKDDYRAPNLILTKKRTLKEVFRAYENGTLPELLAASESVDMDPLVSEWEKSGALEKYVTQVRVLVPKGKEFPSSHFTRSRISRFLAGLQVEGATKNRYRAALLQFARWLIEREILSENPVREVRGYKEKARMVWYERADAWKVIDRLETQESRVIEAVMYATGMELSACLNLRKGDIDPVLKNVMARGGKNKYRTRVVKVMDDRVWQMLTEWTATMFPLEPVFTLSGRAALEHHKTAVEVAEVQDSTLHDWRHTFAVNALREGVKVQVVKRQLGHAPTSTMVERVYGVWIVDESDYEKNVLKPVLSQEKLG